MSKEKPYIEKERVVIDRFYNPNFGDNRICKCGHEYHRHFDSYENMEPIGCKYCECFEFEEEDVSGIIHIEHGRLETPKGGSILDQLELEDILNCKKEGKISEIILPNSEVILIIAEMPRTMVFYNVDGHTFRYKGKIYNL